MEYNTKKLSNDDQPRKEFHKEMNRALSPKREGPSQAWVSRDKTHKAHCMSFVTRYFYSNSSKDTPRQR